jgi:hypothetical protein
VSLSLHFETDGGAYIAFPFQTPTALTLAVLRADNRAEQLDLIDKEMTKWGWSPKERTMHLQSIRVLMDTPGVTLSMM